MNKESSKELGILVQEAKGGDKEAFREIFEHLNNRLFSYALSRTSSRDDALDVVQDTFIDLWGALGKFEYRSKESFYSFVFVISKRKLYKYYKSKNKTVPFDEDFMGESYEMKNEDYRYLLRHLNALTPKYRDLITLRYWSCMTFGEIASFLNIKETTAKVRHHRAIKKLQVQLTKYENTI